MGFQLLVSELVNDPLGRGYAGMTNEQAAADLNAVYRSRDRNIIPVHEVFEAIAPADLIALDAAGRARLQLVLSQGEVNIRGANTRAVLQGLFNNTNGTITRLAVLHTESISRATELGVVVDAGMIQAVRA